MPWPPPDQERIRVQPLAMPPAAQIVLSAALVVAVAAVLAAVRRVERDRERDAESQ